MCCDVPHLIDGDAVLAESRCTCIFQSSCVWYFINFVGKFGNLLGYAMSCRCKCSIDISSNSATLSGFASYSEGPGFESHCLQEFSFCDSRFALLTDRIIPCK